MECGEHKLLPNVAALRCRLSLYTGSPICAELYHHTYIHIGTNLLDAVLRPTHGRLEDFSPTE